MRRTKIVSTIGPASEPADVFRRMLEAGVNVVRINMSHGEREDQKRRLDQARRVARQAGVCVGFLLDLKGPEIRVGKFEGGEVHLEVGQAFTFSTVPVRGTRERVFVDYERITEDVRPGATLLLDDGNLVLEAVEVTPSEVRCRVVAGGRLSDRKKINLPDVEVRLPAVSERDVADIRFGVEERVDFLAASFVRKASDVLDVRRVVEEAGGNQMIIAKIESAEGVRNLEEILQVSDGLMVARGDLGVEVPVEEVPLIQKRIIERANHLGKPVITATQMLESMVQSPRPTRAEASDVANAILDGTDAIMLSAETAVGKYPVEAVATMSRIAERIEESLDYERMLAARRADSRTVTDAISHAVCTTAQDLGAAAIITATHSGHTARMVSKYRPKSPIVAVTSQEHVSRQLTVTWGVTPQVKPEATDTDEMVDRSIEGALQSGVVRGGDLVVITAGVPLGVPGTTNLIQVHTVGEVILRGQGIGQRAATGRARIVRTAADVADVAEGDIVICRAADIELMPALARACGIIAEEGGLTSHAAVAGLSLGIPVIVGAENATRIIEDGSVVTVDGAHGLVYRGRATVR